MSNIDLELLKRILTVLDVTDSPCGHDSVLTTSILYNPVFTEEEKLHVQVLLTKYDNETIIHSNPNVGKPILKEEI